jgi:lysophospholipase L1-like esterase
VTHRGPRPDLLRPVFLAAILLAVVALVTVWLIDRPHQGAAPDQEPGPAHSVIAVSFAVVGDSITEADSPGINAGSSTAGSWTFHASDRTAEFVGGWARSGATTRQMAEGVSRVRADCLVVLAGTNDVAQGIPFDQSADNLRSIVSTAGIGTVIVSTIPPFDPDPQAAARYNRDLAELAAREGWTFSDPMEGVRAGDRFRPALSADGVHPTEEGARMIGESLRAEVLRVVAGA